MTPDRRKFGIRIHPLEYPRRFIPDEQRAKILEEEINWNKKDLLQIKADEITHRFLEATSTSLFSTQIAAACQTKPFKKACWQLAELYLNPNPSIPLNLPALVEEAVLAKMFEEGIALSPELVQERQTKIMADINHRHE